MTKNLTKIILFFFVLIIILIFTLLNADTIDDYALSNTNLYQAEEKATTSQSDTLETKSYIMTATAYSWECGTGDNLTATMTTPQEGITVAVDPRVIPLGSRLRINGQDGYIAQDTGGLIQNKRIDLFFNCRNDAINYGVQTVEVELEG